MEQESILIAHCPTCDKYTQQEPDESGAKSCFICHTPYVQSKT